MFVPLAPPILWAEAANSLCDESLYVNTRPFHSLRLALLLASDQPSVNSLAMSLVKSSWRHWRERERLVRPQNKPPDARRLSVTIDWNAWFRFPDEILSYRNHLSLTVTGSKNAKRYQPKIIIFLHCDICRSHRWVEPWRSGSKVGLSVTGKRSRQSSEFVELHFIAFRVNVPPGTEELSNRRRSVSDEHNQTRMAWT